MSRKKERGGKKERENNAKYYGHLRLCQQPRAAHALRSDQYDIFLGFIYPESCLEFIIYLIFQRIL
jgi:hypothetical protein